MLHNSILIFSDGSSRGNPGPGGWGAVLAVRCELLGVSEEGKNEIKIVELGGKEGHTTNNRMELTGAAEALFFLQKNLHLTPNSYQLIIYTDSSYLINGITKWVYGWQKNGWKTKTKEEVLNRDLWEQLLKLISNFKIEWKHVGGHIGIVGNERCDEIATSFADGEKIELFDGNLADYKLDILNFDSNGEQAKKKKSSSAKAYSYISMIDRAIQTHKTWAECEKRAKGAKGAKYKKVFSEEEEKELISEWGSIKK